MNNIQKLLSEIGRSQAWLSDTTDLDISHVSRVICDKIKDPRLSTVLKICKAFKKPIEEVFYESSRS